MTDEEIVEEFRKRREARLEKAWGSTYTPRNPIASDLSDCRRYQVVRIIGWQVRAKPDTRGMETIESGTVAEPIVVRQLQDEGWDIVEGQAPFDIRQPIVPGGPKRRILSGKIDGKIRIGGELLPLETKDTNQWTLEAIETERDLHSTPWRRKWWRQIQSYLIGHAIERGILLVGFRGQRKPIVVHLDYQAAEEILQLCTWAVELVDRLEERLVTHETLDAVLKAEGIPYHSDYATCRMCPFRDRACFPPEPATGTAQIKPELLDLVKRFLPAKAAKSEYDRLRKAIARETEGFKETIVGEYVIEGEVSRRSMKAKPAIGAHVQEFWSFDVRSVGERSGIKQEE